MDDTAKHGKAFEVAKIPQKAGAVETGKTSVTDYNPVNLDEEATGHEKDTWLDLLKHGWLSNAGSNLDAGLTSAAAQVGQVMLTLPHAVSLTGIRAGVPLIVSYTLVSMWTVHLLNALYLEYKRSKISTGEWYAGDGKARRKASQYFEVVGHTCGRWLGAVALVLTVFNLVGNGTAQIVAGAANTYSINPVLSKRGWTLVWGALSLLMTLVPSFRDFRLLNVIALAGTGFTAIYICVSAGVHGFQANAVNLAPYNFQSFFTGANVFLWAYGGHGVSFEIIDAMWKPSAYDWVYPLSYLFTFSIATPHSILVQLAYPKGNLTQDNVYGVLPKNGWMVASIIIMLIHQIIAYALYVTPIFFMWEKLVGTHYKPAYIRLPSRLPVALLLWFIAIAFPFYGLINSIIGALTGSMVSFILPALAYNLYYLRSAAARANAPKQPPRWTGGWTPVLVFNAFIIIYFTTIGFGIGGYASIKTFVDKIRTLGVFVDCYQCKKG
ncbi:g2477 [Coccomyxa viridis]|uniref:G2477 protein n=1 Tax=Coccomyxa viridis TaxID=1274662 RepID=A0ABP1FSF2_9CHLO